MKNLILRYERDFFSAEFCNCKENLESRLSKNFIEYGKSGAVYDRDCTISSLMSLAEDRQIEIKHFELISLSVDVLLVHYTSHDIDTDSYALRTSIWRTEDGNWKLYFHQGTPEAALPVAANH